MGILYNMSLFSLQLICSFFIGGAVVALQSFIAEKVPKALSGIILCLPSTIIVNFFFLGFILKPNDFQKLLPLVPAPIGISLIFIAAYIYIAKWISILLFKSSPTKKQKIFIIVITSIISSTIWLLMSLPFAVYQFDNFILSLLIFMVLAWLSHLIMTRGSHKYKEEKPLKYKPAQQLGRAIFAGLMVATTVYFGQTMGAFWGGVIAMFPAAFLAAIAIIHYYYSQEALFGFFKTVPLGSTTLILYAWVSHYSFPMLGVIWGTCVCVAVSFFYSWLLSLRKTN
jgi:hypothetical protein